MSGQQANLSPYFKIDEATGDLIETFDGGHQRRWVAQSDGTFAPMVSVDGSISTGGGGSAVDRELVVVTYYCKTAFTGASVGDTITATQVIDVSGSVLVTIRTIWRNQTTAADLSGVPSAANLSLVGADSQTDRFLNFVFVQSEDLADTTYVLKSNGASWLMTKIVSTTTTDVATYAGAGNNAAITFATAWSNRADLVYGSIAAV